MDFDFLDVMGGTDFNIDMGPIGKASGDDGVLVAGGIGAAILGIGAFLFGKSRAEAKKEEIKAEVMAEIKAEIKKAQAQQSAQPQAQVQVNQVVPPAAAPVQQASEQPAQVQQPEAGSAKAETANESVQESVGTGADAKSEQQVTAAAQQPAVQIQQNNQQPQQPTQAQQPVVNPVPQQIPNAQVPNPGTIPQQNVQGQVVA